MLVASNEISGEYYSDLVQIAQELPEWLNARGISPMKCDLQFGNFILAIENNSVCGFIHFFVFEGICFVSWMAIKRCMHRKGIGTKLLNQLFEYVTKKGSSKVYLKTLSEVAEYEPCKNPPP